MGYISFLLFFFPFFLVSLFYFFVMKAIKSALLALAIAQLVDGAPSHQGDDQMHQEAMCDEELLDKTMGDLTANLEVPSSDRSSRRRSNSKEGAEKQQDQEASADEKLIDDILATSTDGDFFVF